jgi:hypothetical protein
MSNSWDEGRVVPLTRHQDTAAASAPAGLSRPGGPLHRIRSWPAARSGRTSHGVPRSAPLGSPTHHTSFSVRNKNESVAPLMADGGRVLFWEEPSDHLFDIFTRPYDGLAPLVDREPRRQAVRRVASS